MPTPLNDALEQWLRTRITDTKAHLEHVKDEHTRALVAGEIQGYRLTLTHLMYPPKDDAA